MSHTTDEWRLAFVLPALGMVVTVAWCWSEGCRGVPGEHHGLLHCCGSCAEGLVALAVVFMRSAIVEGGIDTWGCSCCGTSSVSLAGAAAYVLGQGVATARALLGPVADASVRLAASRWAAASPPSGWC